MIIGIEGTGSQDWGDGDLQRTFVRRILNETTLRPASYFIGPNNQGSDATQIINGAFQALLNGAHNKPVVLVGYSRGAAYCLEIARRFGLDGGFVDILVMFDAVSRQGDISIPENVPGNVGKCFHAYRDPRAGSRYFFSNVGLHMDQKSKNSFEKKSFFGSHGAIGGTYYNAYAEEHAVPYTFGLVSSNRGGQAIGWVGDTWHDVSGAVTGRGRRSGESLTPDDRDQLNIPRTPQTDYAADCQAQIDVAKWMWPRLIAAGVLPQGAKPFIQAPPFSGSKIPGTRNVIR